MHIFLSCHFKQNRIHDPPFEEDFNNVTSHKLQKRAALCYTGEQLIKSHTRLVWLITTKLSQCKNGFHSLLTAKCPVCNKVTAKGESLYKVSKCQFCPKSTSLQIF